MQTCASFITGMALAVAAFVVPIQAETIGGTFEGDATLTPTGTPGFFIQNFTGDGDDTALGSFTVTGQSTIDFTSPPAIVLSNGTLTQTFGNGTIFGTSSGTGTGNGAGVATFTVDFLITGGTGAFLGDKGEAFLTGTITQTSATTESIAGTYTGSAAPAATPEPGTWMLFAVGFAAAGFRRVRAGAARQSPAQGRSHPPRC
jgi:hypothetical protein